MKPTAGRNAKPRLATMLLVLTTLICAPAAPAQEPTRVLLIGDSITKGQMSGPAGVPFAQALRPLLGPGYEVVNVACGGTTTVDWTISNGSSFCDALIEPNLFEGLAVPELPAEIVTIMFGTNDSVGFFEQAPVPVNLYRKALTEITANLFSFGAETVILMTPPRRPCNQDTEVRNRLIGYRRIVLEACDFASAAACGPDVFTLLDPMDDFAGCDVHPNQEGHAALALELAATVLALE